MGHPPRQKDLPPKALDGSRRLFVAEAERLQGDALVQLEVEGFVYLALTPSAEESHDAKSVGEDLFLAKSDACAVSNGVPGRHPVST